MDDAAVEAKSERFQMAVSSAWLEKVDDWRFANRVGSRATAIRQLVEKGLKTKTATE